MSKSPTGCLPHPRFYTLNSFNAWLRSTLCRDCHMAKVFCVIRSTHPNGIADPVGLFPDLSGRKGVAAGLSRMRAPWTSPGKLPHRPLGGPQPPVDPGRSNDPTHRNGIRGALPDSVRFAPPNGSSQECKFYTLTLHHLMASRAGFPLAPQQDLILKG